MSDDTTSRHSDGRSNGWIAPAALVVAVIAVAIALFSLTRTPAAEEKKTSSPAAPTTSTANVADTKTQLCQAFDMVRNAVSLQTNTNIGTDPAATSAVAANSRLATLGGGQFLLTKLADAAPGDLTDAVRSFADDLQYIGIGQLAGAAPNDPTQTGHTSSAQNTATRLDDLCK